MYGGGDGFSTSEGEIASHSLVSLAGEMSIEAEVEAKVELSSCPLLPAKSPVEIGILELSIPDSIHNVCSENSAWDLRIVSGTTHPSCCSCSLPRILSTDDDP